MASDVAIAIRKKAAIDRIAKAMAIDLAAVQHRDPRMAETLLLEAIADSAEQGAKKPASLREAIAKAPVEELTELPGVGEATAKAIKKTVTARKAAK